MNHALTILSLSLLNFKNRFFSAITLFSMLVLAVDSLGSTSTTTTTRTNPALQIHKTREAFREKAEGQREQQELRQQEVSALQAKYRDKRTELSDRCRRDMKQLDTEEQRAMQELLRKYEH